jgi:hypothetical protein
MKRLKVGLALALALAMMVTISVAPALANNNDNGLDCHKRQGPFIRCDGDRFVDVDRADNLFGHRFNNDGFDCFGCGSNRFLHNDVAFSPFFVGCWVWDGDEWEWEC